MIVAWTGQVGSLFEEMVRSGQTPTTESFQHLIASCINAHRVEKAFEVRDPRFTEHFHSIVADIYEHMPLHIAAGFERTPSLQYRAGSQLVNQGLLHSSSVLFPTSHPSWSPQHKF